MEENENTENRLPGPLVLFPGLAQLIFCIRYSVGVRRVMERKKPKPHALKAKHLPRPTSDVFHLFCDLLMSEEEREGRCPGISWHGGVRG